MPSSRDIEESMSQKSQMLGKWDEGCNDFFFFNELVDQRSDPKSEPCNGLVNPSPFCMCQSHGFKVYLSFLWLDAIPSVEQVRLAPSLKSQRGAAWCKTKASFNHWELEMIFRVSGRGRVGADGLVRKSRRERFRVI